MNVESKKVILNWMQQYYDKNGKRLSYMVRGASDFQNNQIIFLSLNPSKAVINHSQTHDVTQNNLIENCIFFAVRKSIEADWLNNQDQFLFPNDGWKTDQEFQNDCLAFTLFHSKNMISSKLGTNHWIPFTEKEVNAKTKFESNFMTDFIAGKLKIENEPQDLFNQTETKKESKKLEFSEEATAVFNAGRNLWKYYHSQQNVNVNASLYDIREYFQGRNDKGKMNNKSDDETYMKLITELRSALKILAKKIEPKVYEYGFLKE